MTQGESSPDINRLCTQDGRAGIPSALPPPFTTQARRLIRDALARGPQPYREMRRTLDAAGIPAWAVRHAKAKERVVIRRRGFGRGHVRTWELPPPPAPPPDPRSIEHAKTVLELANLRLPSYEDGKRDARRERLDHDIRAHREQLVWETAQLPVAGLPEEAGQRLPVLPAPCRPAARLCSACLSPSRPRPAMAGPRPG
jgi:hypothetical protein